MDYLAVFDIGTSDVKGILVSADLRLHHTSSRPITTRRTESTAEQDPESWWLSVQDIMQIWWKSGVKREQIKGVTFSGQMEDCIPIDKRGKAVRPAILYSDPRGEGEAAEILERYGEELIRKRTGNHLDGKMTFPKMLWLRRHEPYTYARTDAVLISSKDYIIRQLTGRNIADPTTGATTGMMDLAERQWVKEWLEDFVLNPAMLPDLMAPHEVAGKVTFEAAGLCGLAEGTPVLAGIGDGGASTLGAGVTQFGQMYVYLGTTGWAAITAECVTPLNGGIFHLAHAPEKTLIAIAPLLNAGNVHQWALNVFSTAGPVETEEDSLWPDKSKEGYGELEKLMLTSKPTERELLFLPYLNGERCPIQAPEASGCFIGIKTSTTRADMSRAVLEGVAMSLRQVIEILTAKGEIKQIALIGGGSRSEVWSQTIADVCRCEVLVPEEGEFLPALGAAAGGFIQLGWSKDYSEFSRQILEHRSVRYHHPDEKNGAHYTQLYKKYVQIYETLRPLFE